MPLDDKYDSDDWDDDSDDSNELQSSDPPQVIQINSSTDAYEISTKRGTSLAVRFIGVPTAGYRWRLVKERTTVDHVGEITTVSRSTDRMPRKMLGGYSTYELLVTPYADGRVELQYLAPSGTLARTVTLEIDVTDQRLLTSDY